MKKRLRWSGNTRIISDIFWCLCIALLLGWSSSSDSSSPEHTILPSSADIGNFIESTSGVDSEYLKPQNRAEELSDQIISTLARTVACFFMFFFWSWRREHVQCYAARIVIHAFCWIWFIIDVCALGFLMYFLPRSLNSYEGCYILILMTGWSAFIVKKYVNLMWERKENLPCVHNTTST